MSTILTELECALVQAARAQMNASPEGRRARRPARSRRAFILVAAGVMFALGVLGFIATGKGGAPAGGPAIAEAATLQRLVRQAETGLSSPSGPLSPTTAWKVTSVIGGAWNWHPVTDSSLSNRKEPFPPISTLLEGGYTGAAIITNRLSETSVTSTRGRYDGADTTDGPVQFYGSAAERRVWERHMIDPGLDTFGGAQGLTFGEQAISGRELFSLPTTASGLLTALRHRFDQIPSAGRDEGCVCDNAALFLLQSLSTLLVEPVPSKVRAAVYRALSLIPGVKWMGLTRDLLGRTGVGFALDFTEHNRFIFRGRVLSLPTGHLRNEIVLGSHSGDLLQEGQFLLNPPDLKDLPQPLPVGWQAFLSGTVVAAKARCSESTERAVCTDGRVGVIKPGAG